MFFWKQKKIRDLFEFNAMFFKTLNLPLKHTAMRWENNHHFIWFQMLFFIQHHWVCGSNRDFISFFLQKEQRKLCLVFISLHKVFDWGKGMKFSITYTHMILNKKNMTKQYEKEIEHWAYHKRNIKNTRDVTYKKLYSLFPLFFYCCKFMKQFIK